MKLIIDIPEELYESAKNDSFTGIDEYDAIVAIKHGILIEDIKSEIQNEIDSDKYYDEECDGMEVALEIINKHIGE